MSTKTSIKRIALVAVAALGFGMVSTVSANAAASATTITFTNAASPTTSPVAGTAVVLPINVAGSGTADTAATATLKAELTTKPTNSALNQYSAISVDNSVHAAALTTAKVTAVAPTAYVASTSGVVLNLAAAADATNVSAALAANFSFTPDVPGKYVVTFTKGGTATTAFVANDVEIIVSGAALVQAASGLGTATGTQTSGAQSAAVFFLPAASTTTSRYTVTASGASIIGAFRATTTDAANANSYTAVDGIVKQDGSTFNSGFQYTGQATVTAVTAASEVADAVIVQFTSASAGTATVTLKSINATTGVSTTLNTVTVTYGAAVIDIFSASNSTVYAAGHATDAGGTTPDATTDATAISTPWTFAASAAASAEALKIVVDQEDANDINLVTAKANTVSISGPGSVSVTAGTAGSGYISNTAQNSTFYIFADGRSGVSTITVSSNGVVMKTYKVTFYGAEASYTQTASKTYIGVAETGTLTAKSYDAAGILASATPTVYAVSSSTSVATVSVATNVVTVTGVASGTANISICNTSACTDATIKLVVPVTITKATAKTVAITFDKDEYAPGELMTVTVSAQDSNGSGTADATRSLLDSTGITSSVALSGSTLPTTASVALVGGKATYTAYAPLLAGPVKLTAKEGTATDNVTAGGTAAVISASANVVAAASTSDAIDAANEATDAANAATDAANAAAEAADAATAAAQDAQAAAMDAQAAVAALATSVSALIAGIKAQITTLTNLVIKIQKKVKA